MKDLFRINPEKRKVLREIGKSGVEAKFVEACRAKGWKCYKFTSEMNRGVSDRIVFTTGQVWFVEVKKDIGRLTELQKSFRTTCLSYNLNHFVVYGLAGIKQFIQKVEYEQRIISK